MKRAWLLAAGAALVMSGCGQKGPLYLPDKNAKVVTSPAATNTADAPATLPPARKPGNPDQDSPQQPPKS